MGSLISAYAPLFARLLQLQDQLDIPLGLVFKQLGLSLPETHLSDPQAVFRQLRVLGWSFPWLQRRAMQIDRRHGPFENRPIEAIQPPDTMKVF